MSEKLLAGVIAAVVIAPLCTVCILGPAVLASVFGGLTGWFGGLDPFAAAGIAVATGVAVFAIAKRRSSAAAKANSKLALSTSSRWSASNHPD